MKFNLGNSIYASFPPTIDGIYVSLTNKKLKYVSLTRVLQFVSPKELRVFEKKVNETQVSKTVFGDFKFYIKQRCNPQHQTQAIFKITQK